MESSWRSGGQSGNATRHLVSAQALAASGDAHWLKPSIQYFSPIKIRLFIIKTILLAEIKYAHACQCKSYLIG